MIRGEVVMVIAALCGACVSTGTAECPDHTLCSDGRSCVLAPSGAYQCASEGQLAACKQADEGTLCSVGDKPGTCFGGGCILAVCGDGVQDADPGIEACDDGNKIAGDGCSADCSSAETCGNGIIDLAVGEECDDSGTTLSGDGCTGHCLRESRLWRDVTPHSPPGRTGFGFVTDPRRGATMVGGGSIASDLLGDTWRWDGDTWNEVVPPATPDPLLNAAVAYDAHRERVVMFGGIAGTGGTSDATWEWDGVTWRDRAPATRPGKRTGAAMACNASTCVLFGGTNAGMVANDTWLWDGTTWTERVTASPPPKRRGAKMAYDPLHDEIVMCGGFDDAGTPQVDLWVFANNTWTSKTPTGSATISSLAFDPSRGKIVLVDGITTSTLDPATHLFTSIAGAPPGMSDAQLAWDQDSKRFLAVGSAAVGLATATLKNSTWTQNGNTEKRPTGEAPGAAFDPRRGTTVVLDPSSGTFEWNGHGWKFRAAPTANARDGVSVAHDPVCGVTLSFAGGPTLGARSNDVYRFPFVDAMETTTWQQVSPTGSLPGPRTHQAMSYDSDRHVFVVFGGVGGVGATGAASDTWELASADCITWAWTERTPASGPSGRYDAQLAYDPVRKVTVLFGGAMSVAGGVTVLDDTWEWNGTAWTRRSPTTSPAARSGHGMTLDPRRKRIVLFGGKTATGATNDAWEWHGEGTGTWTQLAPAVITTARTSMGFAQDVSGSLVAINGSAGGSATIGVQRLTSELNTELPDACEDAGVDSDGDGVKGCADPDCASRCTHCGDATCDPVEDYLLCPADCTAPPP